MVKNLCENGRGYQVFGGVDRTAGIEKLGSNVVIHKDTNCYVGYLRILMWHEA